MTLPMIRYTTVGEQYRGSVPCLRSVISQSGQPPLLNEERKRSARSVPPETLFRAVDLERRDGQENYEYSVDGQNTLRIDSQRSFVHPKFDIAFPAHSTTAFA
jgi:hypothetical protein